MKKGLVIFLGIIIIIVIVAVAAMLSFNKQYQELLKEVDIEYAEIGKIDMTKINDGEYSARFGKIPVIADLTVKVEDHHIVSITMIEQSSGPGYEALETIDRIIEKQQPKVDIVTGATTSSKVIMIAVKKALNQE